MSRRHCIFILTYGRPDNVKTLPSLLESGYTGDWFLVVDDSDATLPRYIENFGLDKLLIFNKQVIAQTFDLASLSKDYRSVVFARNACFDLAKELGYTHFLQLDDDYKAFNYRYEDSSGLRDGGKAKNIDKLINVMFDFLDDSGISAVAFGQRGDLIGGVRGSKWISRPIRKMMNAIFCRTSDEWRFIGRVNEDVNTYTTLATRGHIFLSIMEVVLDQSNTQQVSGGYTELYKSEGTYQKSMYSVIMCPSAVSVSAMGESRKRIHHRVSWNNCTPKIIPEKYKKD